MENGDGKTNLWFGLGLDLGEIKKIYDWDESRKKALYNSLLTNLNINIMNIHFLLLKKKH